MKWPKTKGPYFNNVNIRVAQINKIFEFFLAKHLHFVGFPKEVIAILFIVTFQ